MIHHPASSSDERPPRRSAGQVVRGLLRDLLGTIVPAIIIALLITHFVGQFTFVLSQSMEPNLYENHRLIIEKVSYQFHGPRRGDIVVLDREDSPIPLIKRVIGLPGEKVEIRDNTLYIDGVLTDEPYLEQTLQRKYGPITVPPLHILVMGDNRMVSYDSRAFGPIAIEDVRGKAWLRVWPLDKIGSLE